MVAKNGNGNSIQLPVRDTVVAIALAISLGGAFWTIMQTQFTAAKEREDAFVRSLRDDMAQNVQNVKELFNIFQMQIDRRQAETLRRDEEVSKRISSIQNEINERFKDTVGAQTFAEFTKSITTVREQIKILETTRPTTGELQAVASLTKDQLARLEERVRSLEDNLRRIQPIPTERTGK